MLNNGPSQLKSHLQTLRADLAQTQDVDDELHTLLRDLDGDIRTLLERRATAEHVTAADGGGLAERTQELTAKFAVEHPRLEPALRELGRMLSNMGI